MLVDTHVHVVSHDEDAYPLSPRSLSGPWYREAPHSAEDLIACMERAGIDRAVLVQPVGAYSFDNRYATDSAAAHPGRFVSACCVDPETEDANGALRRQAREHGVRGVRLFALSATGPSWLAQAPGLALFREAADLGIQVIATIFASQLGELRRALEKYPTVPVSLDHCGFPNVSGNAFENAASLFALADLTNLHLKVTTHVLDAVVSSGQEPAAFVQTLVGRFGAERVMWGSDFCQTHDRPYDELVAFGHRAFEALPGKDRAACLGGTAERLWQLA